MYNIVHDMRTRIITSPSVTSENILGAILFENTMEKTIEGVPTAQYLWQHKKIVPFLKVDQGLADMDPKHKVQLLKPMPQLDALLERAQKHGIYGTKMRSLIHEGATKQGIQQVVTQQFEIAQQILQHGLIPIIEPEVDIHGAPNTKADCEAILAQELLKHLDALPEHQQVMLKLSLPTHANQYLKCIQHPRCLCVWALSGGYSQDEANRLLALNHGMRASFSRALTEGLKHHLSKEEFDATLLQSIEAIATASKAGSMPASKEEL